MPVLRYTEGDTVTLNCKKRSNNSGLHHQFLRPVKYYWYKRFAVLYLNETVNKLRHKWNSSSPLFQLKDLSLFESATYTCKVVDENVVIEHEFTVVVSKGTVYTKALITNDVLITIIVSKKKFFCPSSFIMPHFHSMSQIS